jgi:uncharacterized membrane protein YcjF (UPF0283 family)
VAVALTVAVVVESPRKMQKTLDTTTSSSVHGSKSEFVSRIPRVSSNSSSSKFGTKTQSSTAATATAATAAAATAAAAAQPQRSIARIASGKAPKHLSLSPVKQATAKETTVFDKENVNEKETATIGSGTVGAGVGGVKKEASHQVLLNQTNMYSTGSARSSKVSLTKNFNKDLADTISQKIESGAPEPSVKEKRGERVASVA